MNTLNFHDWCDGGSPWRHKFGRALITKCCKTKTTKTLVTVNVFSTKASLLPSPIKLRPFELLSSYKPCEARLLAISSPPLPAHSRCLSQREPSCTPGKDRIEAAGTGKQRQSETGKPVACSQLEATLHPLGRGIWGIWPLKKLKILNITLSG